jgi:hypothetical protein
VKPLKCSLCDTSCFTRAYLQATAAQLQAVRGNWADNHDLREVALQEYLAGKFPANTNAQLLAKRDPELLAGFAALDPRDINGVLAAEVGTHECGCMFAGSTVPTVLVSQLSHFNP